MSPATVARTDPAGEPLPADARPLPGVKPPPGAGRLGTAGIVLSVATIAIGLVALRDALVSAGLMAGPSFFENRIKDLDGLEPQWWWVAAGVVSVLAGLFLAGLGLLPRPRSGVELSAATGVSLDHRGVRRIATRAADDVDGVLRVRAHGKRRLTIALVTTGPDERIEQDVRAAVTEALSAVTSPPPLRIRARTEAAA